MTATKPTADQTADQTAAANPDLANPDLATAQTMLRAALGQITWARNYSLELLAAIPRSMWFDIPTFGKLGGDDAAHHPTEVVPATNIAWQVGHLAVSQYGLMMFRIHGRRDDDLELIPGKFRKAFSRGSDPRGITAASASPDELLDRLRRVHESAMRGLTEGFDPQVLLEPVDMPYAVYPTKLGAILFCPLHEQIHSGQIGLIRRALGLAPIR
jgi:hypothetical protein